MSERTHSFGYWLRRRRKALDLTQDALAERVAVSGFSIRKIEADERRPSRRLAERLAAALAVPDAERDEFIAAARAARVADGLAVDASPVANRDHAADDAAEGASSSGASTTAPSQPARVATDATPFVGRRTENDLLVGMLGALASGAGQTVLLEGEPGIGKSRLIREVAREAAARGHAILATNCYEIERGIPYQPVVDLVTRALDHVSREQLAAIPPVSLAELASLVPEIGERVPGLPQLANDFPAARQARLPRAVVQLVEAARRDRPAFVAVDDIQWADEASLQVFHYLARHAAQRPLLVVYAYRDEELDADERLARLVESLRREIDARRVPLHRLDAVDTERLVAQMAAPALARPDLAERLHRETEGNPFFLVSILHSLAEGETRLEAATKPGAGLLPDALRAAVRVRLAHVPKALRHTLEAAAVLGRRFDFDTLAEVTREPEAQLLDALDALVKRRLLREEPDGGVYDFSHDKVREVVYRDIGATRRRLLHQAVAAVLERTDQTAHERDGQLAEHYERAHDWSKALRHLSLAGERSMSLFAMRDALDWIDRAIALAEAHPDALSPAARLALHEQRGAARAQAGHTQGAVEDIRRVLDAARAAGDRVKTRDTLVRLGMAYRRADAYEDATACLTEALAESRAMSDEHNAADTLYHLGTVAWSDGLNDQAIAFHSQAVDICERMHFDDLVGVQAWHGRGEAHFANAEPVQAIESYSRSLVLARAIGDRSYECENLMMIGHACLGTKGLGDYARARANFEAALAIARDADLQWHMGPTLLGIDHAKACTGRYGEAWTGMQETVAWLASTGQVRYRLIAHDFIAHLLLDLGLAAQALASIDEGLALGRETGIGFWRAALDAHRAIALVRLGERATSDDVGATLAASLDRTRRTSERYLLVRCLEATAEVALARGDAAGCMAHADELLAIATTDGLREMEASARRWRGKAAFALERHDQSAVELDRAAALADAVGRVRLARDVHAALARVRGATGDASSAARHDALARSIVDAMRTSAKGSALAGWLPATTPG